MPIPAAVVPNPTILDLTKISLEVLFSYFKYKIPESIFDVKVPIKLDEKSGEDPLST